MDTPNETATPTTTPPAPPIETLDLPTALRRFGIERIAFELGWVFVHDIQGTLNTTKSNVSRMSAAVSEARAHELLCLVPQGVRRTPGPLDTKHLVATVAALIQEHGFEPLAEKVAIAAEELVKKRKRERLDR